MTAGMRTLDGILQEKKDIRETGNLNQVWIFILKNVSTLVHSFSKLYHT